MLILESLNPQQQEAIKCTEGPLLILAGAGSGKTRVLTHRIAYLIFEKKVYPGNILAITFTNKAAQEMRERLEKLIGVGADKLWASTFHSTCVKILRREITALGYTSDFVIYDSADQQTLLKMILKDFNIDDKKYPPRTVANKISNFKNDLKTPDKARMIAENFFDEQIIDIYAEYQKRLKSNNAVDFDDLIMLTVKLFTENPDVLNKYQERFKYILVDEYQDTNTSQYMLVKLLAQDHRNLCVVGDDDQSIYQWRGADIRNILSFEEDYQDTKVIKLEQNYRSTQSILNAANEVIAFNQGRKGKNLWTDKKDGEKLFYYTAQDEVDEALFITRNIKDLNIKNKYAYKDFAVLCRVTGQFRAIEEGLIRGNIPYRIYGGTKFYDRKEIKDILAYLKVIVNPADNLSLQRIINTPKRGIGASSWDKLFSYANSQGLNVFDVLDVPENAGISVRIAKTIKSFGKMLDDFRELSRKKFVTELTTKILEDTGYIQELQIDKSVEAETRLENLQEFLSVTRNYDTNNLGGDLPTFLAETSLMTDTDNYDENEDAVVVMTMHAAKGLEFPVIFITGMEEGIFPHSRSINSDQPEELEEERRLCYVALTRAMEKVYLTRAWRRNMYGRDSYNAPSRFIEEIPVEYIEGKETKKKENKPFGSLSPASKAAFKGKDTSGFSLGEKVEHMKWGEGVVVAVQGEGEEAELKIAFPDQEIKTLIAKYAPLRKI